MSKRRKETGKDIGGEKNSFFRGDKKKEAEKNTLNRECIHSTLNGLYLSRPHTRKIGSSHLPVTAHMSQGLYLSYSNCH